MPPKLKYRPPAHTLRGMSALSARFTAIRLLLALLLMTIGVQALAGRAPDSAPAQRGSAFSVGTNDVAVLTLRQDPAPQVRFVPPLVPPPLWAAVPALLADRALPRGPALRPDSTAPPAREWYPLTLHPRGPPSA